ncbi:MAG: hypothetical protein AAFQ37_15450, partial [Bacteroidota bacterium]
TSDDGTITLTVTGGSGNYTYDWADLAGSDDPADRSDLAAGTYSVTVTDASGCTAEASFTIDQPEQLVVTGATTDVTCNDDAGTSDDGTITLTVIGGSGNYTYDWADLAGSDDPADRSDLAAGTYSVTVTDASGCTAATSFTIDQPEQLVVTGNTTDVTCNDDAGTSDDGT